MLGATSSINNYPNVFGIQSGQSAEQLAQTLASASGRMPSAGSMPTDTITISSSANMLQQFLNTEMQGSDGAQAAENDLMGLAQLKQRGDMLASMLQLKMKNFESQLTENVKGAGLPLQNMSIKGGDDGLLLMGDMPNKEALQSALDGMKGEFSDIARLAEVLNTLKQLGPEKVAAGLSAAAQYAQQSLNDKSVKKPDSDFVMQVMESGMSFTFE